MALTTEDIKAIREAHPVGWFVRAQQRAINQRAQDRLIAEASSQREKELVERLEADYKQKIAQEVTLAKSAARVRLYQETRDIIDQALADNLRKIKAVESRSSGLETQVEQDRLAIREMDAKLKLIRNHLRDYILGTSPDETILIANLEIILDKDKALTKMVEAARRRQEQDAGF